MFKIKRICIFCPYSGQGNISGIQVRLRMLAYYLNSLGYDVHVIGPYENIEGATTHDFSLDVPLWHRLWRGIAVSRIIRRLRPSVVILEGPTILAGLRGVKVFQMIHDSKFATAHRRRGGMLLWLYYFLMCRVYSHTITVSEAEKDRIATNLQLSKDRIIVSYNGIGENWLRPPANFDKEFDLIYVSNFAKHKGHIRFLRAIVGLGYRVALVGGDLGTLDQVQTFAESYDLDLQFFHGLSEAELITLYDRSKVFVFPSELEGFGIPFLEARARDLPVVASDIEVFHELAADLGATIVDFADASAVRAGISAALKDGPQPIDTSHFLWRNIVADLSDRICSRNCNPPRAS
ncbi:glycosyltransferase family 4 protein [Sulfitobacter sp.]|uniref:glycosyltransferase family 4 protein n=1 Tax=Sulfitobacter sp. TaxID=1903071 RepID=UPI002624CD6E|nr:glycosyltransferase family 4 protein [Sulfitobacter sp.]